MRFLKVAAIIAEFNPLHNGHKYLIDKARSMGAEQIIVILGGNFTQRGDLALFSKFTRAETALACGADLIAELPISQTVACAQLFATGGVFIAAALGADTLIFGSESGDIEGLKRTSDQLDSPLLKSDLRKNLSLGKTYAAAQKAAFDSVFASNMDLSLPNDILGIEYISAIKKNGGAVNPICIKRLAVAHDSDKVNDELCIASASAIRQMLCTQGPDRAMKYLPSESHGIVKRAFNSGEIADINRISTAILCKLRTMSIEDYVWLPDISEGLEHRIKKAVEQSCDLNSLLSNIKTKRYTMARIKRLIISAFLDIDNTAAKRPLEYIRILGCSKNGIEYIRKNIANFPIPVALRTTDITDTEQFKLECRATDLYNLALAQPKCMNLELTFPLITDIL